MPEEWVEKLKTGDLVVVRLGYSGKKRLESVAKTSKTQVTLSSNQTFMKRSCKIKGAGRWDFTRIEEATHKLIDEIKALQERDELISSLTYYIGRANNDQLKRLWAATDEV